MFKEFLKIGTPESSMRLAFIWAMWLASFLVAGLITVLVIQACTGKESADFTGGGAFLISIGVFIAPFIYGKIKQLQIEKKNE